MNIYAFLYTNVFKFTIILTAFLYLLISPEYVKNVLFKLEWNYFVVDRTMGFRIDFDKYFSIVIHF